MKVALASPPLSSSLDAALEAAKALIEEAALQQADIICFPESYLPGYPLDETSIPGCTQPELDDALSKVCTMAKHYDIAVIMPMDWHEDGKFLNVAQVISREGEHLGMQTKNQLDPSEDNFWVAGTERKLFEIDGVKFGITICHEGFRYPETVRWAAQKGAHIVFHPQCTGSDVSGFELTEWGNKHNPYYEKAMMMRALENTIYFASCNYSFSYPESAGAIIAPDGSCLAHNEYRKAGIVVAEIDIEKATGLLARRFKNDIYFKEFIG